MNKIIGAFLVLLVGAILLPPFKNFFDGFYGEVISVLPGLNSFESLVMSYYPLVLLVAVFVAAALVFLSGKKKEEL